MKKSKGLHSNNKQKISDIFGNDIHIDSAMKAYLEEDNAFDMQFIDSF
jgi:hypothetical protein